MTPALLFDEDVPSGIVRAIRRRIADADVVRVQDVGLRGSSDEAVLAWAAEQGRVTVTCDHATMIDEAVRRVLDRRRMPGLLVVRRDARSPMVVADLQLVMEATSAEDWDGQIGFVPL